MNVLNFVKDIFFTLKRTLLFSLFSLIFLTSFSQSFEQELKEALTEKPKFEFRFDSRNSFINQNGVRVIGVKAGIQFDKKLSFGLGYNQLWSKIKKEISVDNNIYQGTIGYYYFSPYVEYAFYKDEKWQLSIPVQFGLGESFYTYRIAEKRKVLARKFVFSYEPAIAFEYRFLDYFGAGMGVGYRLMIASNKELDEQFTSPVYIFKLKIYFERLWEDIKP